MSSYPAWTTHPWNSLVVGGSAGEPLLFKLYENPLIENGSFEEELENWDGTGARLDYGSEACHGNYVLDISISEYMHKAFSRSSLNTTQYMDNILFAGFVKMTKLASATVTIRVYCSGSATRVAAPTEYIDFDIQCDAACMTSGANNLTQWVRFYFAPDISGLTGDYVHFEIFSDDYSSLYYYLDDLRVHEIKETVVLECPQKLTVNWSRKTDSNYEMADGANKDYVRGWRPIYQLGYEYCSKAQLISSIGITENEYNFFAPQRDSANGDFVRMIEDLNASYFQDRFIGHESDLPLMGIYLRKFKPIEYGQYFSVTEVP